MKTNVPDIIKSLTCEGYEKVENNTYRSRYDDFIIEIHISQQQPLHCDPLPESYGIDSFLEDSYNYTKEAGQSIADIIFQTFEGNLQPCANLNGELIINWRDHWFTFIEK